mmetsp:Transcript_19229/g.53957  ORF Transcript_19229/g.53957 Transcript_19229/m.53957 type:complete len:206 (+) Transcript_19229:154-771(+)
MRRPYVLPVSQLVPQLLLSFVASPEVLDVYRNTHERLRGQRGRHQHPPRCSPGPSQRVSVWVQGPLRPLGPPPHSPPRSHQKDPPEDSVIVLRAVLPVSACGSSWRWRFHSAVPPSPKSPAAPSPYYWPMHCELSQSRGLRLPRCLRLASPCMHRSLPPDEVSQYDLADPFSHIEICSWPPFLYPPAAVHPSATPFAKRTHPRPC